MIEMQIPMRPVDFAPPFFPGGIDLNGNPVSLHQIIFYIVTGKQGRIGNDGDAKAKRFQKINADPEIGIESRFTVGNECEIIDRLAGRECFVNFPFNLMKNLLGFVEGIAPDLFAMCSANLARAWAACANWRWAMSI